MSFLDVPGVKPTGLDAAVTAKATTGGTALNTALNATYAPVSGSANYTSPATAQGIALVQALIYGA